MEYVFVLVDKNIGRQFSLRHFSPVDLGCDRLAPGIGNLHNLLHIRACCHWVLGPAQGESLGLSSIVSWWNLWIWQGAQSDGSCHGNMLEWVMTEGWSVEDIFIMRLVQLQVRLVSEDCWQG